MRGETDWKSESGGGLIDGHGTVGAHQETKDLASDVAISIIMDRSFHSVSISKNQNILPDLPSPGGNGTIYFVMLDGGCFSRLSLALY
jgi:hypothetical protein